MTEIIYYELALPVTVRRYEVDTDRLRKELRHRKSAANLSNREIALKLGRPITEVEHWFRTDKCFSIPDADVWYDLKDFLRIETEEFDGPVTEFIEKPGVFEKANRFYHIDGLAPTLTVASAAEKKLSYREILTKGLNI